MSIKHRQAPALPSECCHPPCCEGHSSVTASPATSPACGTQTPRGFSARHVVRLGLSVLQSVQHASFPEPFLPSPAVGPNRPGISASSRVRRRASQAFEGRPGSTVALSPGVSATALRSECPPLANSLSGEWTVCPPQRRVFRTPPHDRLPAPVACARWVLERPQVWPPSFLVGLGAHLAECCPADASYCLLRAGMSPLTERRGPLPQAQRVQED